MKPRLLDLFCKAGGAAVGYSRAGFEVEGVDIEFQPRYPFHFDQGDALDLGELLLNVRDYDAIHASPPCQAFSRYKNARPELAENYPDLIAATREMLQTSGLPYVIENVEGAPLERPVTICGVSLGRDVRRHRLFESSFPLMVPACACGSWMPGRYPSSTGREPNSRRTIEVGSWDIPYEVQADAMEVDWPMTLPELSNAIPPSYTELIGHQLMQHIRMEAAA